MSKPALAERAWAVWRSHQRSCATCYDLGAFARLEPCAHGHALPDELCVVGRRLLEAWLAASYTS